MTTIQRYMPFLASALLMCVVVSLVYPHYQYYIDPDGTAYLTISRRYATGDLLHAINSYWSPWGCWLTALLMKAGMQAIPASVVVNAAGATGFLFITQSFFLRFGVTQRLQWICGIMLAFFLCHAIFWQSFDDLWECFLLLSTLRIMLAEGFTQRPVLWLLNGFTGALAYFAKAYSFPFFMLNTICCTYLLCKADKGHWLKICAISIITMLVCSAPWIYALHIKYGIWITGSAGTLNMSWYLVGHPHYKAGLGGLLPPIYPDSPSSWEDPYLVNGDTPHFWSSPALLLRQVLKVVQNCYKLAVSSLQLSVFFPLTGWLLFLAVRGKGAARAMPASMRVVALSFLLFPIGFILINFEPRYIWYMVPLSLLAGSIAIDKAIFRTRLSPALLSIIFPLSSLIYPAWGMVKMYDEGKKEHEVAMQLKTLNIHGSFICIARPGANIQRVQRLAYLSGDPFYSIYQKDISPTELLHQIERYHIRYFIVYEGSGELPAISGQQPPFEEVTHGSIAGIKVYQVNP